MAPVAGPGHRRPSGGRLYALGKTRGLPPTPQRDRPGADLGRQVRGEGLDADYRATLASSTRIRRVLCRRDEDDAGVGSEHRTSTSPTSSGPRSGRWRDRNGRRTGGWSCGRAPTTSCSAPRASSEADSWAAELALAVRLRMTATELREQSARLSRLVPKPSPHRSTRRRSTATRGVNDPRMPRGLLDASSGSSGLVRTGGSGLPPGPQGVLLVCVLARDARAERSSTPLVRSGIGC